MESADGSCNTILRPRYRRPPAAGGRDRTYNSAMFRPRHGATLTAMMWTAALTVGLRPVSADDTRDGQAGRTAAVSIKVKPNDVKRVELRPVGHDTFSYELTYGDGTSRRLSPDAYAAMLYEDRSEHWFIFRILNIHSAFGFAWVTLGLAGQTLFVGRMIVQWITSERHRRSLVPVQFWWMSLGGASMLLVYFIWRRDIVGILGQSVGWIIYIRNLYFIYRPTPP